MLETRRNFLRMAGLSLAGTALPILGTANDSAVSLGGGRRPKGLPILQGPTDHESASFVILHPRSLRLTVEARGPHGEPLPLRLAEFTEFPGLNPALSEFVVYGLLPELEYQLLVKNESGEILDSRFFGALETRGNDCRFAVVSCMDDNPLWRRDAGWNSLARPQCDFVVFLGDTCYADSKNSGAEEATYARRYMETRSLLRWFYQPRLTPSFATWDDHDFGLDNADREFRHGIFTAKVFRSFWGTQENSVWKKTHGVGSVLRVNGQRFYFMDDRSFRDPCGTRLGRHWGENQTQWLLGDLAASNEPAWLMNGSQFFGGYLQKESVEADHPGDLQDFLKHLARIEAPVAFVSGDVHFSEIMEIEPKLLGYRTYEFTSSAIHSLTIPFHQHRAKNSRRLVSEWRNNYLLFDSNVTSGWKIQSKCVLTHSQAAFQGKFEIQR